MKRTILTSIFLLTVIISFSQNKIEIDTLKIIDLNQIIEFEKSLPDESSEKSFNGVIVKSKTEPIPNALKNVFDRLYVTNIGIETYRENLDELLGRIIFDENGLKNIGLLSVKLDTVKINSFIPKQGKLLSQKLTKKSSASISLFINASASEERIYEYYVNDISRAILKGNQINKESLKKLTSDMSDAELKQHYVVTGVTVTEIFRREFEKKTKKIKADNFPLGGAALSFEGNFFVSDDNFEREYKIGLTASRLDIVKKEVKILLD
ncbi:hypothetical protein [Lacinutrix jangbogonensis]|uniref:hypothetical protein n=1 Tax=Lacinutrix jangbogonensis TaxID=1469557 RepID=UPI00053E2FAD|nr:hypothetical protein [Lacinutrix jangbogonensis]